MNIEKQSSTKQRVIFAGTPEFAAISLQALIEQQQALNIEIVAVYTQPDRKAGRGQKLTASPVLPCTPNLIAKQVAVKSSRPLQ